MPFPQGVNHKVLITSAELNKSSLKKCAIRINQPLPKCKALFPQPDSTWKAERHVKDSFGRRMAANARRPCFFKYTLSVPGSAHHGLGGAILRYPVCGATRCPH